MRLFDLRKSALLLLVLMLAAVTYGFAASNTVPDGGAGDGQGTISGYTIGNVSYNLLSTDPSKVASVSFTVTPNGTAPAASVVKITLDGTTWIDCTAGATAWTCAFASGSEPTVLSASQLRVVATE